PGTRGEPGRACGSHCRPDPAFRRRHRARTARHQTPAWVGRLMAALLYGATGYSGGLVLAECLARGLRPILGGRSEEVAVLARAHGLESRVVGLDDPAALRRALAGVTAVLHCAGP